MEGVKVLGHGFLLPLVLYIVLVLGQAVDGAEPALPVVLGQTLQVT